MGSKMKDDYTLIRIYIIKKEKCHVLAMMKFNVTFTWKTGKEEFGGLITPQWFPINLTIPDLLINH